MLNINILNKARKLVFGLLILFIILFIGSFWDPGGRVLLFLALLFLVLGTMLTTLIFSTDVKKRIKVYLYLTGTSSILFSLGLMYGIFGIWGYYEINDPVYVGSVIVAFIGFIIGISGSLLQFRRHVKQNSEELFNSGITDKILK